MKKLLICLLALPLMLASCSKDNETTEENDGVLRTKEFTASMGLSKAGLYLGVKQGFEIGDSIAIFPGIGNAVSFVSTTSGSTMAASPYYSVMNFIGTINTTGNYTAVFPYRNGLTMNSNTIQGIVVPEHQKARQDTYDPKANIAVATSTNSQLRFSSVVAFIRFRLINPNGDIVQFRLDANRGIVGSTTINRSTHALSNGSAPICYLRPASSSVFDSTADYYMAIIPGTFDSLVFKALDANNAIIDKQVYYTQTLRAGGIYTINITGSNFAGSFDPLTEQQWSAQSGSNTPTVGWFTTSGDFYELDTISFTKGNLQYQPSTRTWRFAEHQYDLGAGPAYGDYTSSYWHDMFVWGSGNNPLDTVKAVWEDTFYDWGNYCGLGEGLRTLTGGEFHGIVHERTNAQNLRGWGSIVINSYDNTYGYRDSILGILLLPNNWVAPQNCNFTPDHLNRYNLSEWTAMENAGAVFLPIQGYGNNHFRHNINEEYWTSSRFCMHGGYGYGYFSFDTTYIVPHYAFVRLVHRSH